MLRWGNPDPGAVAMLDGRAERRPKMPEDQTPRTEHPPEGRNIPLPGIKTAAEMESFAEHYADPGAELEGNELHQSGSACARCGKVLGAEDEVRRTASGTYQHEFCPPG
jgi:hypothetical protein